MAELRGRLGLGQEAPPLLGVIALELRHLDGDQPVQQRVVSLVDRTEAALPQNGLQFKATEFPQGGRGAVGRTGVGQRGSALGR